MRTLLIAASPGALAAAAPLPCRLVVDPARRPALVPGEAVAVDCGGRRAGVIDPPRAARRALAAYDRRHLAHIVVARELQSALQADLAPGEGAFDQLVAASGEEPCCDGVPLLATITAPGEGWRTHVLPADRARREHAALGDAAAADLRAGHPTALVVVPLDDGPGARAAERAARALAIAALRAAGKARAPLVLHGDAVLRAFAAATRSPAYRLLERSRGLVRAALGTREVLIAPGPAPRLSPSPSA